MLKPDVDPRSIRRSQLYDQSPGSSNQIRERSTTFDKQQEQSSAETSKVRTVIKQATRFYKAALASIRRYNNVVSWELDSTFTIFAGGTQRTIIPFNRENVHGQGGRMAAATWFFQPPPKYAGDYDLDAFLTFKSNSMAAITHARLEVWKTNRKTNVSSQWRVIDAQWLEMGNVADDAWLARVKLNGGCGVPIGCDEAVTIVLWCDNAVNLTPAIGTDLYGWVDLRFNGCMGTTNNAPRTFTVI